MCQVVRRYDSKICSFMQAGENDDSSSVSLRKILCITFSLFVSCGYIFFCNFATDWN